MPEGSHYRHRLRAFIAVCVLAVLVTGVYIARTIWVTPQASAAAARLAVPPAPPYLMVRSTASDDSFRKLLVIPLRNPAGASYETALKCERAYFAGDRGVCLAVEGGLVPTNVAHVFDGRFTPQHRIPLTGIPTRTRLSPDGRRAAITVFERGHSYAEEGFSTRTTIVDTATGGILGDLEQYAIEHKGKRFQAVDFNFWGVTFRADGNRFFATLATGGVKYLIEGDINARAGRVIRSGIECPSLSPDNTQIVYKNLIHSAGFWQLRLFDLRTGADRPLTAESRSVDDQVDWLDDSHVLYHITGARGADVWVLNTTGTDPPTILRQYAYSPAVVRE